MKTSVVLLALATAALAAPAQHEETFQEEQHIPAKFLNAFTRERKSLETSANHESPVNLPTTSQISEFGVSGRSFNLKKPIIIKKKVGSSYQVYRDSDEEKLDSPEPCRKQVRVNLCDEQSVAKSSDMMSSSTIEDIQTTEEDMKHSIMLAKEAVENLQKDLRKIEQTPAKTVPWKHGDSASDVELHQDIEKARQALEHIHNNFGILETTNTEETSVKAAEHVEDVALPLAQSEEERLAQWKNALQNIQRNVELVRNIEDSFTSTQDDTTHTEDAATSLNKHELHKLSTKEQRITDNAEIKEQPAIEHLENSKLEKSSEHNEMKTDIAETDMIGSASMVSAAKLQELSHNKARLTPDLKSEHMTKENESIELHGKDAVDTMTLDHLPQNLDIMSLKIADEEKEIKTETKDLGKEDKLDDSFMKKSSDAESNLEKDLHTKNTHMTFKQNELATHLEQTEDKKVELKSAELPENQGKLIKDSLIELIKEDKIHEEQMKQASEIGLASDMKTNTPPLTKMKTHESMVQEDHSLVEKASESLAVDQLKPMMGHTFKIKTSEDTKNMQHQLIDQDHMRWAQENFNTEHGLMKSAEEPQQTMNPTKMHSGHPHHHQHAGPHHLDASHGHLRHHDHFMAGKSADMDNAQANYYMNMRDSDNMGPEGHRFRWRPTHMHESGRTAYGASSPASAPATGAVGLFPNANVGGCGIPLLLSCNPSVVSGSLTKANPASYSAPAYRSEDDFNFHTKRDVKKAENVLNTLNKTNPILKRNPILVSKQ